ncbi:DUF4312 family protein [Georgenia deserti]|uniref:DUF4312 family protein n=1 Tax=Georgenia deserti TaxID=2093781 RepID=A0ABW4L1X9_9MICO
MRTARIDLELTGTGDTEERALGDIFRQVSGAVRARVAGPCLRIEPMDLAIRDAVCQVRTEKFLGLMFARRRETFRLTATVTVEVRFVDLERTSWRRVEEQLSPTQHLLEMR